MVNITEHIQLSTHTTLRTGGPARYFALCASSQEILEALNFAKKNNLKVFVLGCGSNLLVSDGGFSGLVVKIAADKITHDSAGLVTAGAGVVWDDLVKDCCDRSLCGIEALSGIPGLVGAAPVQNIGAYGQEVSETITSVTAIHRQTLTTKVFSNEECEFGYRQSLFKLKGQDQWIITEVSFHLHTTKTPIPKYEELKLALEKNTEWQRGDRKSKITAIRHEVLKIRSTKGMVLDSKDPDTRSVGSFFVNPIVSLSEKERIFARARALACSRQPTAHPAGNSQWKLSAAWLIENSGIKKGQALGKARVSTKHVLAITNPNDASTKEVLELAALISAAVWQQFGIELEKEPIFVDG